MDTQMQMDMQGEAQNGGSGGGGGGGGGWEQLLTDLTAAAGAAPTALWVPGVQTYMDDELQTEAGDGDRVYQINDLTGNGYHMREGASGKGPTLRTTGIGTKPALDFLRTNSEFMQCVLASNGATPNLFAAATCTQVFTALLPDNDVSEPTAQSNPAISGSNVNDIGGRVPSMFWRDNVTVRVTYAAQTTSVLAEAAAPYDTALILAGRHNKGTGDLDAEPPVGSVVNADKTEQATAQTNTNNNTLTQKRQWGFHASGAYLTGKLGAVAYWNITLTDAQLYDVVDVLRAYAGLDPIADPE